MYMYISLIHIQLDIKKFVTKFLLLQAICGFSVCIISPCGRGLLYLYTHVEITTTRHFVQFLSPNLYELSFDENLATLKFPTMCYYGTCRAVLVMNDMVWIDRSLGLCYLCYKPHPQSISVSLYGVDIVSVLHVGVHVSQHVAIALLALDP